MDHRDVSREDDLKELIDSITNGKIDLILEVY